MSVNLDNIHFYHQPPPPKPSLPTSRWMPYQTPSVQHCFSHPLLPKPPVDAAATLSTSDRGPTQQPRTSTREGDISYRTKVRNEFDVELERLSMAGITAHTRIVHQPNLERTCDHVAPDGAVRDVTQNHNTSHVVTRKPAQPEASANDDNKTTSQSSVQQSISQEWPNREMCQLLGNICSSDAASRTAEAEQDLLGLSIATKLHQDSILLSEGCSEINAQISSPTAGSHNTYTSRSPSADLSISFNTSSHHRGEFRTETMEYDKATLQNTRNEIRDYQDQGECLGDEAAISRSVKNNRSFVTTRPSPASNAESGILKKIQPSAVSSSNRPLNSTRLSKMPPTSTRSLCPRPNANTDPERLPSVSVVIIVRESDKLIAGTTTNHQIRSRNNGRQDGSKSDDAGDRTGVQDFPNKR
ncbi:hypothetical protein AARAC_011499 [Aspergillus arachidicola]|uniref:Uncharacterized protein n=1 Tax=Aspergillus arachidicola TaxID=656916 RepID=A0A2G7EPY2_9EURO|nr:hypothetical protein AARAC_011499 [Aspergillus arachidicola]